MNKLCRKIKQSLCIGLIIFGIFQVRSQAERPIDTSKQKQSYLLEDIIQSYVESRADDGNFDYNTLADRLEYLQSHPVNINSPDQIDDLVLLTPSQIINIKNYILQHGELISIYELQAVPGMDINSIKMIMPFVRLNSNFENYNVPLVEMLRFGDNQLFLRTGSYFQKSVGYDHSRSSFYNGSPQRFYMRFKHFYENKLSIGLTAEKDPGEEFFKGSNKQGFDYYSFHFALRNINKTIQDIVIGDYNVSFGQGLIIHSGFGIGKSPWATSIRKADRTIRPYTSVNESNFLRGAAANLRFTKKFDATLFASRRRKDGNVINDSLDRETLFSSFQESGYHRTSNEIADENAITENTAGGAIRYKTGHGHIGLNTMYTEFGKGLLKQNLPYNQFAFKGQRLFQYSVDHSYQIKNFNFFGEAAFSNPGTYGWMEGLHLVLDKNVDMAFLYRHLDRAYPALYSNAFTENTLANNERGLYIGTEVRPSTRWKLSGYWDIWAHPWLKYNVQSPSRGHEELMRITYTIRRKMVAYIQYRNKNKQENSSIKQPIRILSDNLKKSIRLNLNYTWSKSFETRSRVEFSKYQVAGANAQNGFMIYQDLLLSPENLPFSLTTRLAYFKTDNYDSGIYAYENDLLYNFYVPNYNGTGFRYYLNTRYDLLRDLTIEGRFAITSLSGVTSIGSGLDQINGNKRSEWKVQLRWNF